MARVRGRGNLSTEQKLVALFRKASITGWRRHLKLPGTPDFAFPQKRLAIFVDGCFWHGCPKHATSPKTNRSFWRRKLANNVARDCRVDLELRSRGWRTLRIWEHELAQDNRHRCLARIRRALAQARGLRSRSSINSP